MIFSIIYIVLGSEDERGTEPLRLCPRCKTEQMVLKKTKDGRYDAENKYTNTCGLFMCSDCNIYICNIIYC